MTENTAERVARAQAGDAEALENLIDSVRDRVYRLSLRMVTQPADAEDATQEILLKALTRLSTFRGDAGFSTWVHRIAVNHLLDRKKSAVERMEFTFDLYAEDLRTGLADPDPAASPEAELLVSEVRLGCTQAMLTCLDREHRVAYVLGEVFEVSSGEGSYICAVSPATYRKRLSRARSRVRSFLSENCGVVNPDKADCRCSRRVETAVSLGRIDPRNPTFAAHPAEMAVSEMEELYSAAGLMRSHPEYTAPESVAETISKVVRSGRYAILED
jgi:RNA polymerase sigma factor (sigma-70 family)